MYQTARARYVEGQEVIRRSIEDKKLEKEGAHLISQMLYGVPQICKFRDSTMRTHIDDPLK